jgi:predicted peptidase
MKFWQGCCALLFTAQAMVSAKVGETREWTSADGRKVTGKLEGVTEEGVSLRIGGKSFTLKLVDLAEEDQAFVRELVAAEAGAADEAARSQGFTEGKYAEAVKGEWVKFPSQDGHLLFQLFIGKEVTRKKAGPLVPLVIHLHGASARANDVEAGKVEIAPQEIVKEGFYKDHACVVCVPTCPPEPETWGKQTEKLEKLVDDLVANLPIDRSRIYLSGYSQGAQGIGKMLESRPEAYAAAIFADGGPSDSWPGKVKTPLWSYYSGERDSSKAAGWQEAFEKDGVEFRFDVLKEVDHNGIHWKIAKEPKVLEWVFAQKR